MLDDKQCRLPLDLQESKGIYDQPDVTTRYPRWFDATKATWTQRLHAAKGRHPTGRELGGNGKCRDCIFYSGVQRKGHDRARCSHFQRYQHGEGTLVVKTWPSCEMFEDIHEDVRPMPTRIPENER